VICARSIALLLFIISVETNNILNFFKRWHAFRWRNTASLDGIESTLDIQSQQSVNHKIQVTLN
jgi:hypothetical protein